MDFNIHVADRHILIHSVYPQIYNKCEPYRTDEIVAPELEIRTDESTIRNEIKWIKVVPGTVLDPSDAEIMLVQKLLAEALLSFDTLLMHGAVVAVDNAAYLFTANSGTGKTTHIQSWLKNISDAYVVNGDKPFIIVRKAGEAPLACGSPWAGKENLQTNAIVPLKAIVLLERAEENQIEHISLGRAFPFLLQQVYRPEDEEKMRKTLRLIQRMSPAVSFWRFHCNNFKDDCFDVVYRALVGGEKDTK